MDMPVKTRPVIKHTPVRSTQIHGLGHHPETNTMSIQFPDRDGNPDSVYHYANVTADQYEAFVKAPSIGSHFGKRFKKNTDAHPYTKIS